MNMPHLPARRLRPFALALTLFGGLFFGSLEGRAGPGNVIENRKELDHLAALRAAGVGGDRSRTPALIDALYGRITDRPDRRKRHPWYVATALRALGQLGASDALPHVEALARGGDQEVARRATAARARLLAEAEAQQGGTDGARTGGKIDHFLKEVGLTLQQIQSAVSQYQQRRSAPGAPPYVEAPLELYALEELADILYRGPAKAYGRTQAVQGLKSLNYEPVTVKLRYAALPREERIRRIVVAVSAPGVGQCAELKQLAVDEGAAAGEAALQRLRERRTAREKDQGFWNLVDIVRGVGDKGQNTAVRELYPALIKVGGAPPNDTGGRLLFSPGF